MSRNHWHCIVVEKLPSHRHEKLPSLKPNELIFESTLWWPWAGIKLKGPHQIKWNLKDNEYHNIWIFNFQMNQFFQKISSKIVFRYFARFSSLSLPVLAVIILSQGSHKWFIKVPPEETYQRMFSVFLFKINQTKIMIKFASTWHKRFSFFIFQGHSDSAWISEVEKLLPFWSIQTYCGWW